MPNKYYMTGLKLEPKELWILRALQAKTKLTASDVLRRGLHDLAEKHGIQPPEVIPPMRGRYDRSNTDDI